MSLHGKVAIVTGGARGIGAGIVRCLSKQGAKVAFNYVSPSSKSVADALVNELRNNNDVIAIQADMTDPTSPKAIIDATVSAFQTNRIDILVNNAGAGDNRPLEDVTQDNYTQLMDINVRAVVFMTQAILPYLPTSGGRIINLSSISARGGYATQSVYAATKAAVEGLTRVWATELGHKYGVTVNAVNPGPVDTDMYQAAGPVHLARMEEQNKKVPAGQRCGTVQDIGDIVTFLAEERSRWVTGDVICANGGMLYT
ncbi:SDR family NAD(P)-dependent oxidoreductase [Aspergillus affinis]|uniref:SDR family NAD(P)-dependent oxidoreductase n=1 Tax=Aspergillus affinis TaxID=1070780 RepID=UPI0022FE08FA|nr:short chain dehydrogenase [Aspergillus affinis]KAI9041799.1 short chain dehydrogenase [Aspergillus affinis]